MCNGVQRVCNGMRCVCNGIRRGCALGVQRCRLRGPAPPQGMGIPPPTMWGICGCWVVGAGPWFVCRMRPSTPHPHEGSLGGRGDPRQSRCVTMPWHRACVRAPRAADPEPRPRARLGGVTSGAPTGWASWVSCGEAPPGAPRSVSPPGGKPESSPSLEEVRAAAGHPTEGRRDPRTPAEGRRDP